MPERNELPVKVTVQMRKKRRRPNTAVSQPLAGITTALAARYEVMTHDISSMLAENEPCMSKRVLAWEKHYPWVSPEMLAYFRSRVPRARRDSLEAIDYVIEHATTYEMQERCVAALIRKTEILWHLLDCAYAAYIEPGWGPGGARAS